MLKLLMPWKTTEIETYANLSKDGNKEVKNVAIRTEFHDPKGVYKKRKFFLYQTITDLSTNSSFKRKIERVVLADNSSEYNSVETHTSPNKKIITQNTKILNNNTEYTKSTEYLNPLLFTTIVTRHYYNNSDTSDFHTKSFYIHNYQKDQHIVINSTFDHEKVEVNYYNKRSNINGVINFDNVKNFSVPLIRPPQTQSSSAPH